MIRWNAFITYRSENGPSVVQTDLQELSDLEGIVERGPHWDAIDHILIVRPRDADKLTIEQAARE